MLVRMRFLYTDMMMFSIAEKDHSVSEIAHVCVCVCVQMSVIATECL